ncbi:MAG TPA: PD-(D/E)XK nuclease family protein, partial [Actinomycetes bacterium]|nr:PD-(D/E)XK nuclease family protein [Actinomycetes bacterium]
DYVGSVSVDHDPLGLERTVALRTEGLAFSGRVDRIDERAGQAVIVDYKAGRSIPSETDARSSLALALYADATARTLRKTCRRVELHHVPSGTVAAWEHSDDSIARHVRRAESIGAEIAQTVEAIGQDDALAGSDETFPAKPGSLCGWCDFRSHCPEGQRVEPSRQSWDGLPD